MLFDEPPELGGPHRQGLQLFNRCDRRRSRAPRDGRELAEQLTLSGEAQDDVASSHAARGDLGTPAQDDDDAPGVITLMEDRLASCEPPDAARLAECRALVLGQRRQEVKRIAVKLRHPRSRPSSRMWRAFP